MLKEEGEKSMRKRGLGSKILCGVLVFGLCFNVRIAVRLQGNP